MSTHPASGPISPDELKALADLPAGKATEALRKHDPFWARDPSDKIKWSVTFYSKALMRARTTVEASSEEEANTLAEAIDDSTLDWDYVSSNSEQSWIDEVVPE